METRIAVIAVIVEMGSESVKELNALLSAFSDRIVGRMGIPYRQKGLNIITVAVDAAQSDISELSGKIGKLPGISVKTAYAPAKTD